MVNNTMEGGQAIIRCLENEGVEYIFGYSGGAAIPIFDALVTTDTKINFVLTRHEQGAATWSTDMHGQRASRRSSLSRADREQPTRLPAL